VKGTDHPSSRHHGAQKSGRTHPQFARREGSSAERDPPPRENNLQVVSSLLSLQSANTRVESVRELFIESQNRVTSMALIHEKLYQSADFSQ
jgi:hypothetical protein